VVVHPGHGHATGTLVHGLLATFPDLAGMGEATDPARPGIVHRLDRGTSGLLVVARTPDAYRSLVAQLTDRSVERRYTALVYGHVEEEQGVVDAPIGRSGNDPTRMAVTADGRPARTRYRVSRRLELASPVTLLDVRLETGRTHQIRVHLAAIGHPVVDDQRYAKGRMLSGGPGRPFLHASSLAFDHPASGVRATWTSPLPEELARVIDAAAD
jgi:23S rRNA pseudouridine1911/1915/1917 synthase